MNKRFIVPVILLILLLSTMEPIPASVADAYGQTATYQSSTAQSIMDSVGSNSLRGLKDIRVSIGLLDPVLEQRGLTTDQLQTDIEVRLRKAGIRVRVLSREELLNDSSPYLHVYVRPGCQSPVVAAVAIAELRQKVTLNRDPSIAIEAATWEAAPIKSVTTDVRSIRGDIWAIADKFIEDYIIANR